MKKNMFFRKKKNKENLIIYQDKKGMELCRDWEADFIPILWDMVDLSDFPLTNTTNNHENKGTKYKVIRREIRYKLMIITVEESRKALFKNEMGY